jgi:hypothetical protein
MDTRQYNHLYDNLWCMLPTISSDTIRLWNHNNQEQHSGVDISKIGKALIQLGDESSLVEATG